MYATRADMPCVAQQAGVHSLASIAGAERDGASIVLDEQAENCLRELIYRAASSASRTPSVSRRSGSAC